MGTAGSDFRTFPQSSAKVPVRHGPAGPVGTNPKGQSEGVEAALVQCIECVVGRSPPLRTRPGLSETILTIPQQSTREIPGCAQAQKRPQSIVPCRCR